MRCAVSRHTKTASIIVILRLTMMRMGMMMMKKVYRSEMTDRIIFKRSDKFIQQVDENHIN